MKVIEIFSSIEGEGKRAGMPCTFIRLAGCNLRCTYCDTKYSYDETTAQEMTPKEIINQVKELGIPMVTVTGGEPLIHKDVELLLELLGKEGFLINVETNGSVNIRGKVNRLKYPSAFFTIDYKSPSSGMNDKMFLENIKAARHCDVLKFVVGTQEDLDKALEIIETHNPIAQIYFSPVWGQIEMAEIVDFMKAHKLYNCHIQVQLHKIIWDPEKRGV